MKKSKKTPKTSKNVKKVKESVMEDYDPERTVGMVCFMCGKRVREMHFVSHAPQCYRTYCLEVLKMIPLCTCNKCEGKRQHEGDTFVGAESKKRRLSAVEQLEEEKSQGSGLSTPQMHGRYCVLCPEKRTTASVTTIPSIAIGLYRVFRICKKQHLTEKEDPDLLLKYIEQELKFIREKGDTKTNVLMTASDDEEEIEESSGQICGGHCDVEHKPKKCESATDNKLWIEESSGRRYFCKASHLLRYLINVHCKQGKKKTKGSSKDS